MIETLDYQDMEYIVGIVELQNDSELSMDDFVNLGSALNDDLLVAQFMRTDFVAGIQHLLSASQNAINAWKGKYMISRNLDIEVVLYASAQRQIDRALDTMGTVDGLASVAFVAIGNSEATVNECINKAQERVGSVIHPPFKATKDRIQRIAHHFGITDAELNAITSSKDLQQQSDALTKSVISRVSMVALEA